MIKKEFDDFLRKEEEKKKPPIDWDAEKNWWIKQLDNLYTDIQSWLKEYIDIQKIILEFNNIDIYEEALGTYTVRQMTIKLSDKIAKLTPIGTILIGTKGRVDMTGKAGTMRFILADRQATGPKIEVKVFLSEEEKRKNEDIEKKKEKSQIEWVWKITSNPPRIKYTELNQETFLQCLMQVCNG